MQLINAKANFKSSKKLSNEFFLDYVIMLWKIHNEVEIFTWSYFFGKLISSILIKQRREELGLRGNLSKFSLKLRPWILQYKLVNFAYLCLFLHLILQFVLILLRK